MYRRCVSAAFRFVLVFLIVRAFVVLSLRFERFAVLYAWRVKHAGSADEKERMTDAADFAFRQAVALCPYSPESVFRYTAFLVDENRVSDALAIAETAAKFKTPQQTQLHNLVNQLKRSLPAK